MPALATHRDGNTLLTPQKVPTVSINPFLVRNTSASSAKDGNG